MFLPKIKVIISITSIMSDPVFNMAVGRDCFFSLGSDPGSTLTEPATLHYIVTWGD